MSQEFFAALHDNDLARVERMLAVDPSLAKSHNSNGVSALMQARYEGRHELVALLQNKAGDLDVVECRPSHAAKNNLAIPHYNTIIQTKGHL